MVVDAVEISLSLVRDESKLPLCRADAGQHGTRHLAVLRAHLAAWGSHAVLLVVRRLEGVPLGQRVLHLYAVSLNELQEALSPYLGQAGGTCQVGMQIEIARVAALPGEEREIVLEVLPDAFITRIYLLVLSHECVEHGIVAVKAVEAFLQVLRAVVCAWAVPDWIVEDDFAVGYLLDKFVDDGLHVFGVGVGCDGSAFSTRASAVVRAKHDGDIDASAVRFSQRFGVAKDTVKVVPARQIAEGSNAGVSAVVNVRRHPCGLFNESTAQHWWRLHWWVAERCAVGDAVAYEEQVDVGRRVDGIRLALVCLKDLEATQRK